MRRLAYTAAALALGAVPAVGLVSAVAAGSVQADNGVISTNGVGGSDAVRIDGGFGDGNYTSAATAGAVRPADGGVINSRD